MGEYGEVENVITLEQFTLDLDYWLRQPTHECRAHTCENCHGSGESKLSLTHVCPVCAGTRKQCIWKGRQ